MRLKNGKIAAFIVKGFLLLSLFSSLILLPPLAYSPWMSTPSVFISRWDGSSWATPIAADGVTYPNATGDTYQRKAFKDTDGYYYITLRTYGETPKYVSSSDGENWGETRELTDVAREVDDFEYSHLKNTVNGTSAWSRQVSGLFSYIWDWTCEAGTITMGNVGGYSVYANYTGGTATSNIYNDQNFYLVHKNGTSGNIAYIRFPSNLEDLDATMEYGNGTSVGCKILGYNTTDDDTADMMSVVKSNDGKLYWCALDRDPRDFIGSYAGNGAITQLEQGYNDWCATTEAMSVGAPEEIHLTFINASGFYYSNFSDGAWATHTDLGISGASYPVISVDTDRNLIIMYVRGGDIRYITKPFGSGWGSEQSMTGLNTIYRSPAYLSSNLYEQSGEILLVWTGYAFDSTPPPPNVNVWVTGVLAPYVYVAISVWSLALIIGVGAVLMSQQTDAMPYAVIYGISVTIVLLIALAILAPFLGV